MKGPTFFKTIVLFGKSFTQEAFLREAFAPIEFIKVFRTTTSDELEQILNQSEQTAILFNDKINTTALSQIEVPKLKISGARSYFIDDSGVLSRAEIEDLAERRISALAKPTPEDIKAKLDMYFMSKIQLARYKTDNSLIETAPEQRKSYFTYFREDDYGWHMIASTHEQERDIEMLFNRSWTAFYRSILDRASSLKSMEVDEEFSEHYISVIFPHKKEHERAISVLHIKKDEPNFQEQFAKAIKFLETL